MPSSLKVPAATAPVSRASRPSWKRLGPEVGEPGARPGIGDHLVDHPHRFPLPSPS